MFLCTKHLILGRKCKSITPGTSRCCMAMQEARSFSGWKVWRICLKNITSVYTEAGTNTQKWPKLFHLHLSWVLEVRYLQAFSGAFHLERESVCPSKLFSRLAWAVEEEGKTSQSKKLHGKGWKIISKCSLTYTSSVQQACVVMTFVNSGSHLSVFQVIVKN